MSTHTSTDARAVAEAVSLLFARASIVHDDSQATVTFRDTGQGMQCRMNVATMRSMPQDRAAEALYAAAEKYVVDRFHHFR